MEKAYFVMTVDVDPPFTPRQNYIIEQGVDHLLNLFKKYDIKATFFVPAIVAENFSEIIVEIIEQKHEVGCHGLKHDPLETTLDVNKQIQTIKTATEIIESVIGMRPIGFRAPLFKWNKSYWMALQRNSYVYDSSYVCSPLYGNTKILFTRPFRLPKYEPNCYELLEIPISVNPFFLLPLGGVWLRIFGSKWAQIGIKMNSIAHTPIVFYIHPKDVVFKIPGLNWYYYRNVTNCVEMLERVIKCAQHSRMKFLTVSKLAEKFLFYEDHRSNLYKNLGEK
ncbi:MAG: polysaccharide deacetylase family protein [Candidatus Jordarchaeaceae archaeon]